MSMFDPVDDRFGEGMSTERYHPWHGEGLDASPVRGAEGIAGAVVVIQAGPTQGMSYEQTEQVGSGHHRARRNKLPARWVRPG